MLRLLIQFISIQFSSKYLDTTTYDITLLTSSERCKNGVLFYLSLI